MFVFKDAAYDAQWLRTASHASANGADIGECYAAAREIGERDASSWFGAWWRMATRLLAVANERDARGRRVSASVRICGRPIIFARLILS